MIKKVVYLVPLRRVLEPRFKNLMLDAVMPAPQPAPPRPKPRPRKVLDVYPQPAELEEKHGGDEGLYAELEKVTKGNVIARLKEIKDAVAALDGKELAEYPTLSKDEVKTLVVDDNCSPASPPPSTERWTVSARP